jgi:hypothetical protein
MRLGGHEPDTNRRSDVNAVADGLADISADGVAVAPYDDRS